MEVPVDAIFFVEIWDFPFSASDNKVVGVHSCCVDCGKNCIENESVISCVFEAGIHCDNLPANTKKTSMKTIAWVKNLPGFTAMARTTKHKEPRFIEMYLQTISTVKEGLHNTGTCLGKTHAKSIPKVTVFCTILIKI